MGCDGGSIPKRAELVKTKVTTTTNDPYFKLTKLDSWKYCALSKEVLRMPVVICTLGRLYNKEAVIKYLLDKESFTEMSSCCSHIKGLRDLRNLYLTENPSFTGNIKDEGSSPFVCPVTGKEMNGNFKFVYFKGCGCVVSEQAIKEVDSKSCLRCGKGRKPDDLIILDPTIKKLAKSDTKDEFPRKRQLETEPQNNELPPYNLNEKGYQPSLSGMATFRKTQAIESLYKKL